MTPTTSPDRLRHGHLTTYVKHRCRCEDCRTANREYQARRRRRIAYGRQPERADAAPVRAHVQALRGWGMTAPYIAKAAGLPTWTVNNLIYGSGGHRRPKTLKPEIAERLLQVRPDPMAAYRVPSNGAARRLHALVAIGYSMEDLGRRLGMAGTYLHSIIRRGTCARLTYEKIRALYDQLSMTPNHPTDPVQAREARKARARAIARGWAPPLAWDDDTIDDPTARPYGVPRRTRRTAA